MESKGNWNSTTWIDSDKLKELLKSKGISMGEFSLRIGRNRGWLSKAIKESKKSPYLEVRQDVVSSIETLLSCGIQDITAPAETLRSMMTPIERKRYVDFIDQLPIAQYDILRSFITYMENSSSSDQVMIRKFFEHAQKRRIAELQKSSLQKEGNNDYPEDVVTVHDFNIKIRQYAADNWFYAYILKETVETFYNKLGEALIEQNTVLDEVSLQQRISNLEREAKLTDKEIYETSALKDAREYSGSVEFQNDKFRIRDAEKIKRSRKASYRKQWITLFYKNLNEFLARKLSDSLEIAITEAADHVKLQCTSFLLNKYISLSPKECAIAESLKESAMKHRRK